MNVIKTRSCAIETLIDWGISQGRIKLDGRHPFLRHYAKDPVATVALLLRTPATRDFGRVCPLFIEPYKPVTRASYRAAVAKMVERNFKPTMDDLRGGRITDFAKSGVSS